MIDAAFASPAPPVRPAPAPAPNTMSSPRSAIDESERRIILVDGFNVLHAGLLRVSNTGEVADESREVNVGVNEREQAWWRKETRERLLGRAAEWPHAQDEIWIAFDGRDPSWSVWAEPVARLVDRGGPVVHSLFAESADDWIVRRARRAADPARVVVVSNDRKVTGRSRSAGCEIWAPLDFLARCRPHETEPDTA